MWVFVRQAIEELVRHAHVDAAKQACQRDQRQLATDGVFVRVKVTPLLVTTQIRLLTSRLAQLNASDEHDAEIHGSISNGILVATKVETPNNADVASRTFEFHGTGSALDVNAQTFVLRGLTFQYNNSTSMSGVTLANGLPLEIKATRTSGAWVATQIQTDD